MGQASIRQQSTETKVQSEFGSISKVLGKFAFTNEDIMRKYVTSQFANYMDSQKPFSLLQMKEIKNSNLIPAINMSGSKDQSPNSSEVEEYFKLNRALAIT